MVLFWVARSHVHGIGPHLAKILAFSGREDKCQGKTEWGEGVGRNWWCRYKWWSRRLVLESTFLPLFSLHVIVAWAFVSLQQSDEGLACPSVYMDYDGLREKVKNSRRSVSPASEQWIALRKKHPADWMQEPSTKKESSPEIRVDTVFLLYYIFLLLLIFLNYIFCGNYIYLKKILKESLCLPLNSKLPGSQYLSHPSWCPSSQNSTRSPRQTELQLCWKIEPNCFWHWFWSFRFSSSMMLLFKYWKKKISNFGTHLVYELRFLPSFIMEFFSCFNKTLCWIMYPKIVKGLWGDLIWYKGASLVAQIVKNMSAMQELLVQSLGPEDPLEKEMATHSIIPAWRISWTEEPGRLQSMGPKRQTPLKDSHTYKYMIWSSWLTNVGLIFLMY